MSTGRKTIAYTLSAAALGWALFLPEADSFAAQGVAEIESPAMAAALTEPMADIIAPQTPNVPLTEPAPDAAQAPKSIAAADTNDPDLICLAKVVRHEAANQSRTGQLAVAQLIMNRLRSPIFPKTVCGVIHQAGQFFNTHSYNPSKSDRLWQTAWDVAVEARAGTAESVIGTAIYYNTARARSAFHAKRKHVATIGDHAFYS